MTKDVLVSIKGLQFESSPDDGRDQVELIVGGQYHLKDGTHYVMYDETMDGEISHTILKIKKDRVEMIRKGSVSAVMLFVEGEKTMSNYRIPFGSLMIGTSTSEIRVEETENIIRLDIFYRLEVNYDHVGDCHVNITICSKESGATLFT